MIRSSSPLRQIDHGSAEQAFDAWFGRTLRTMYEPVIHECLPDEILFALRDMTPSGEETRRAG